MWNHRVTRAAIAGVFVLLVTMLLASNAEIARVEAERDYAVQLVMQCTSVLPMRIDALHAKLDKAKRTKQELLGLWPEPIPVEVDDE
jgi:hypothetical protein